MMLKWAVAVAARRRVVARRDIMVAAVVFLAGGLVLGGGWVKACFFGEDCFGWLRSEKRGTAGGGLGAWDI